MPNLKSAQSLQALRLWKATALTFLLFCIGAPAAFAQTFTVLYSFTGAADGGNPAEGLVLDSAGNLYGTTFYGGAGTCTQYGLSGCGTVFKLTNQGTETVLHSFKGGSDGEYPWGSPALDKNGDLFGTTVNGGLGFGIVFGLDKNGTEHILHRFTGRMDGAYPYANLMLDRAGNLYGTTSSGGDLSCGFKGEGCGTLFKLSRGEEDVVHRLAGTPSDGYFPAYGSVAIDSRGNRYGTTGQGGAANYGTIYRVDRSGKYALFYSFTGGTDGCEPFGSLATDRNGNLYGTASACGYFGRGTVFKVSSTGSLTVLYTFSGSGGDGNSPFGGLVRDRNGNLYGTTLFGGNCSTVEGGCGIVFRLSPNGTMTILYSFDGYTDGSAPWCNVILDAAGSLYGTTTGGGLGSAGTVWKIVP